MSAPTAPPPRKPAGYTEQASILGLAGAAASWLAPMAEEASAGSGQLVTVAIMFFAPLVATWIRNKMGLTIGEATREKANKALTGL